MHNRTLLILSLIAFGSLVIAGCGGSAQTIRVSSDFTDDHAALFEDGFDFVKEPLKLNGQWLQSWLDEIKGRVSYSDHIAEVSVSTLRIDTDLERRTSYRVVASVERYLYEKIPGGEIDLVVQEEAVGYPSVKENEKQLLNQNFVAYIKWYRTDDEKVAAHWHMSPASKEVVAETERLIAGRVKQERETARRKVVVKRDSDW